MALLGPSVKSSLYDPLQRVDLRLPIDGTPKSFLNPPHHQRRTSSPHELFSPSPLDGHLVPQTLDLDLYNPIASSNTIKPSRSHQKLDSRPGTSATTRERPSPSNRAYNLPSHQNHGSTASLAEFLKNTGPEDLDLRKAATNNRPVSPTGGRKRIPGSFLLKFAVGKSVQTTKRDESDAMRSPDLLAPSPPLAEPQVTAAGRKYFAIKVDYPYLDEKSISERPLLAASTVEPQSDSRSEIDYHEIMTRKKHHRLSSVLASDTSMEFLVDGANTGDGIPRSSERYSDYPPSRSGYSIERSNSMSEVMSPTESFHDESSIVPGDSVSLRPAQIARHRANSASARYDSRRTTGSSVSHSLVRTPSATTIQESTEPRDRITPPPTTLPASGPTLELMRSLELLDKVRQQRANSDDGSMVSQATTRSLQQRRKIKRTAHNTGSLDATQRDIAPQHSSRRHRPLPPDLNTKGLPLLPPHMNSTTDSISKARAAAAAAKLSARPLRRSEGRIPQSTEPLQIVTTQRLRSGSIEGSAIPEDDVLSLRSGVSDYRALRREKVRHTRQKDLDKERSRRLDEAMRLLQEDVQKKRAVLDKEEKDTLGSETPRQMPSVERLRSTPPATPPFVQPFHHYGIAPVQVVLDWSPNGPRRRTSKSSSSRTTRPKTSSSQNTILTNGPITPVSSAPSSPTRSQYQALAKQPIPERISPAPNYPPPNPSPSARPLLPAKRASPPPPPPQTDLTEEEDREVRIAALEEQKWVLEQALRVLLNQQQTPSTSPCLSSPVPGMEKSLPSSAER
jgi:hypothetical protein